MQSFLALGQEILLSRGGALHEFHVEELCRALEQHLALSKEHVERHEEERGSTATVGVLRAAQVSKETGWRCKVQTCTGESHRLKDCPEFGKMNPRDRMALVERQKLCVDCLAPDHNQSARSCPFKEERVDACKEPARKDSHHHLLHNNCFWQQ
jgi:hypothetical protein